MEKTISKKMPVSLSVENQTGETVHYNYDEQNLLFHSITSDLFKGAGMTMTWGPPGLTTSPPKLILEHVMVQIVVVILGFCTVT